MTPTDQDYVALITELGPEGIDDSQRQFLQANRNLFSPEQLSRFDAPVPTPNPQEQTPPAPEGSPTEPQKTEEPKPTEEVNDEDLKEEIVEVDPSPRELVELPKLDDEEGENEELDKRVKPLYEQMQKQADEQELRTFLAEKPEYKPYEVQLRKYIGHEVYKNVPVDFIARALDYPNAMKRGARLEREAQRKAAATRTVGTPTAPTPANGGTTPAGIPDFRTATPEQMEAFANRVKNGEVITLPQS